MAAAVARRSEGLIVRSVGSETVVFDTRSEQVTCLDAVTARVWDALDGSRGVDELAAASDLPQEEVVVALAKLADAGLLLESQGMSRRALLRGAGTAAAAAPLLTIMAPAPAFAQSPLAGTRTVTGSQQSCSASPSGDATIVLKVTATGFTNVTSGTVTVTFVNASGNTVTTSSQSITFVAGTGTVDVTLSPIKRNNSGNQTVTISVTPSGSTTATTGTATITSC